MIEITGADIYWLTRLDAVRTMAAVMLVAGAGVGALTGIIGFSDDLDELKCFFRRVLPVPAIGAAMLVLIPSVKEAAAIYVIPKLANSEQVQGLGSEFVTLAREWMQELRPGGGK